MTRPHESEQPPTDGASPSAPVPTAPENAESGSHSAQAAPPRPSRVRKVTTKTLHQFTDTKQLVTVMMDAIKGESTLVLDHPIIHQRQRPERERGLTTSRRLPAHRTLYEVGGVLHGDINNNTIIIVETSDGDSKGALVDFDLPYSINFVRKIGNPDKVAPPPQRNRPYYWRPPGV